MKKTLLTLPENLLGTVHKLSKAPTKSKAVIIALEEYVRERKVARLVSRIGKGFGLSKAELLRQRKAG